MIKSPILINATNEYLIPIIYRTLGDTFSFTIENNKTILIVTYLEYIAKFEIDEIVEEDTLYTRILNKILKTSTIVTVDFNDKLERLLNDIIRDKFNISINCNKFFEILNEQIYINGMLRAVPICIPITYADSNTLNQDICNFTTKYYIGDIELHPNKRTTFDHQNYINMFQANISRDQFSILKSYLNLTLDDYDIVISN